MSFSILIELAQLLFQSGYEESSLAKAQGAVLLTHYTSADDPLSGSLWVTRAIENAMFLDTKSCSSSDDTPMSLKKRLWWSILLRDRSLGIGLRRRPQVTSIALQGWSDWLSADDFQGEMHNSVVYSYDTKQGLLVALLQQCRLAVLLTDLASLIFTHPNTIKHHLTMAEFQCLISKIQRINEALSTWQNPSLEDSSLPEGHEAIATLNYLTHMFF